MATNASGVIPKKIDLATDANSLSVGKFIATVLAPVASLRLTVALFVASIFIILVGTLAQSRADMWEVMDIYFRSWIAFVSVESLFPYAWFPNTSPTVFRCVTCLGCIVATGGVVWTFLSVEKYRLMWWIFSAMAIGYGLFCGLLSLVMGGFYFPGGALIGLLLIVNLVAAHLIRFKPQAKGVRLAVGFAATAAGIYVTYLIIAAGHNAEGLQAVPIVSMQTLWLLCKVGLFIGAIGLVCLTVFVLMKSRQIEGIVLGIISFAFLTTAVWLFVAGDSAYLGDAGMRILWQLIQAEVGALVLLAGCVLVFKKRGGIVLIHAGVALLMVGEWFVSWYAVEERLIIEEGTATNYAIDIRETELAVVDENFKETADDVVVVPSSLLLKNHNNGTKISHEDLPFDVVITKYLQNSDVRSLEADDENPATAGQGLTYIAEPLRKSSGADAGSGVDMASMYADFYDKSSGDKIGTYLLSQYFSALDMTEPIEVDGKTYQVALRFKRTYKPYTVHLTDVRKDDYLGTNTPKNYSSLVNIVDNTRDFRRDDIKIWMNNPLRYAGETFYQSGYQPATRNSKETTTLQLVTNTGWMIPYVACMLAATGMCAHFLAVLIRFLNRLSASSSATSAAAPGDGVVVAQLAEDKPIKRTNSDQVERPQQQGNSDYGWVGILAPILVVVIFGGYVLSKARAPSTSPEQFNYEAFGKIPIVYEGRVKPMDTLARNALKKISLRETYKDDLGNKQPATRWLLEVVAKPEVAFERQTFRIENLDVLQTLGLQRRKGFRYSLNEIRGEGDEPREELQHFDRDAKAARKKSREDAAQMETYERKLVETDDRFRRFTLLSAAFDPLDFPRFPTEEEWKKDPAKVEKELMLIRRMMAFAPEQAEQLKEMHAPLAVPNLEAAEEQDELEWEPFATAANKAFLQKALLDEEANPAAVTMSAIFDAYHRGDAKTFNEEVANYHALLGEIPTEHVNTRKVAFESFMNRFAPFYYGIVLCVVAFVLSAAAWLGWNKVLNRSAFWLLVFTLCLYTFAIIGRIYISGRPPVTNLYTSAIFIGWAAIAVGLCLEGIFKLGVGNLVGSVGGFGCLMIAQNLSLGGDTYTVLQAVLDTQFWLSTHVVTITLGYAVTFVAGLLGIIYVILGVFTPTFRDDPESGKQLTRMIYGTVCFALFFSFVGTVLGGLWADDSWGRFWGWDPKENGALIIVIWNAILLHARWGALVKDRGLALLAIGGNIVTSWSWFGVNELGVGLHTYGFTEGVLVALGIFAASQLALIGIGLLPLRLWMSFSAGNDDAPPPRRGKVAVQ